MTFEQRQLKLRAHIEDELYVYFICTMYDSPTDALIKQFKMLVTFILCKLTLLFFLKLYLLLIV